MQLFFNPSLNATDTTFKFDKIESKHIVRVLRKKVGDILHITNGSGFLFTAELLVADDKNCTVSLLTVEEKPKAWKYYLHIAVAPTKLNERLEWFLEKATEIGIDEITPIICHHSERKVIKLERYEKIIQSAMKQSLKFHLPKLNELISFKNFEKKYFSGKKFIAHCEEQDKKSFKKELQSQSNITVLIGPEGDFSTKEISLALSQQFTPVSLGESRLRTETAALVACHSVAFINE